MAREKIGYRDQLGILIEAFPGKISLRLSEAAAAVGVCTKTLTAAIDSGSLPAVSVGKGKKNKSYVVPLTALARWSVGE